MSDDPRLPTRAGLIRDFSRVNPRSYGDRQRAKERREELAAAHAAGVRLDGSPRLPSGPPRSPDAMRERLILLCHADLRGEIEQAAAADVMSVAEWLRTAAIERLARR